MLSIEDDVRRHTGVGGDHELILVTELHIHEANQVAVARLCWLAVVAALERKELEVAHGGDERVRHVAWLAHGVQVEAEVALGGGVHGARQRQAAAVELQRRDVLRHGASHDHVDVLGAGPQAPDDALP
jgi:hypothetical protein